jgi:hypothetical protein
MMSFNFSRIMASWLCPSVTEKSSLRRLMTAMQKPIPALDPTQGAANSLAK